MSFSNLTLMREARKKLIPHWGLGVLVAFVYALIIGSPALFDPVAGEGVAFLFSGPLGLGFAYFSFSVSRHSTPNFSQLFDGFSYFLKAFLAFLCQTFFIVVGILFLVFPGIYIALGLTFTFIVMADRPSLTFSECLSESWRLSQGNRLKILGLQLRFFLWYVLGLFCLGVGMLLVLPWHQVTQVELYSALKAQQFSA